MVDDLLSDSEKYNRIKKNLSRLVIRDSATRIYDIAHNLISGRKKDEEHNKRN
jgi:UDP-N-acetylglucosamine:LPS N-acetylglucosamine transferase